MFKGGVTKTAPPRVGGSERAKLCTSAGMKSSRSSTITTDSRFCRMKRSSSDDALTKPVLGSAASRLRKTVTSGAIAELSDNRACSASGVQSIKRSGIPTPREIPQTISRERLSLREQPKSLTAKKMVTSASTSSLSTLAKHSRGSIKSKGELMVSDKTLLESQVRELLAEAKTKESEISRLRMELQSHKELASPSEDAKPDMDSDLQSTMTEKTELLVGDLKEKNRLFQSELAALREENQTLKQRLITLENPANEASAANMSADNINCLLSSNDPANMSTLTSTDSSELQSDSVCGARISVVEELKDRMQRMEESHHSTSEELQATLQELADQQQVVQELTAEIERLVEEKSLLQTSHQQQRERLELLGQQNESVLQRLREVTQSQEAEASRVSRVAELEQRLTEQVESSRFEREKLVDIQQQLTESLRALEQEHQEAQNTLKGLKDEAKLLQDRLESERLATDKAVRKSEQQILTTEATEVENASLKAQLETERQRLSDLKAIQSTSDHTELQSLLKAAHEERDQMELICAELRQELQQTSTRAQAAQASLDKAEADRRELQERLEQREHNYHANVFALEERSREAENQLQDLKETIFELEDQVEQQRAVRLHTNQTVLDLENQISKQEESKSELERQMRAMGRQMKDDAEEWSRFQADLQTAVVVANDIKVEAQQELRSLRRRLQEEQEHSARLVSELDQIRRARAWPESTGRLDWTRAFLSQPEAVTSEGSGVGPEASIKFLIRSFDSPVPHGPISSTPSPRSPLSVVPLRTAPAAAVSPIQRNVRVQPLCTSAERRVAFPDRGSCEDPKTLYLMRKSPSLESVIKTPSLFTSRTDGFTHHRAHSRLNVERTDPLCALAREYGGSKRNALLKWCQKKTQGYPNIDVTNFSSSWSDGLAFCALLHTYLPAHIPYPQLASHDKGRNLSLAFQAAESVGIKPSLDVSDLMQTERPDWQSVMQYVSLIYKYFET